MKSIFDGQLLSKDFGNRLMELKNIINNEGDEYYDSINMSTLLIYLIALNRLCFAEKSFMSSYAELYNLEQSQNESENKYSFVVEKNLHKFVKDILMQQIEDVLKLSRTLKFEDYRVKNFQDDLRRAMEEMKDAYKRQYNL